MVADDGFWLRTLLLVVALAVVWSILKQRWSIVIVVDQHGVRSHKGLPESQVVKVLHFLQRDVQFESRVTIRVRRERNRRLRIDIAGFVDEGTRQRIRNYFITVI